MLVCCVIYALGSLAVKEIVFAPRFVEVTGTAQDWLELGDRLPEAPAIVPIVAFPL
jgi:hypothetical protein